MAKKSKAITLSDSGSFAGKPTTLLPSSYANLLTDIKSRIRTAQLRAAISVNRELIQLYWDIGKIIAQTQEAEGYGKQVVAQLAADLRQAFPGMQGFSPRNVWRMRAFYLAWTQDTQKPQPSRAGLDPKIMPQLVAELRDQNLPQAVAEIPCGVCIAGFA
ncbi:MAG TPA: DUF1016 N-terminal domain-containing protein [Clostridia bacterium]|nr:DUF1016 N-terminal domain-containing protein [Clostridia bacterium]